MEEPGAGLLDDTVELPPSLHARFEAFELLGRGATGAVYRARDFRLGRDVAIKLLLGADPERGASLLREVRAQARMSHENICEIYEAGTADHARYIVMQLIEGNPLDRAKATMTLEEKVKAIQQIASALHAAHRLGLVHRDVKPSNIMVERHEDGSWTPYLLDFGLAREVGDSGRTVTGAILGTPAFMAPEQAEGKVRTLDRRTDVYGLGATLYDVLTGRPPFASGSLFELLEEVRSQDAAPLRTLDRDIPRDLEAIVMKCLEKEPSARYESARALGDDLQRFLDGEAVQARRGSFVYALRKRVRRHRGAVVLTITALVAIALSVALWGRSRRLAAEQATLSRELGERVKEMELFLRNAHGLPLHDIERERDVVRTLLDRIKGQMAAAGEIGQGPGRYALGRGHLALQEFEVALDHLKQAAAAGYHPPELDYAMGIALGALYRKALEATKQLQEARRQEATAVIEARFKEPALAHLRAALGGTVETPAYAEGLIAFYEERLDEALAKSRDAFAAAPWLYEAKKLEGDVLFERGIRLGHDAAFDPRAMTDWFEQAAEAYRLAADIGRSDPALHDATCTLWTQAMNGAFAHGGPVRSRFEAAIAACERAIAATPRSATGYVKLAWVHNAFAWRVATGALPNEDPERVIAEATAHAEQAVQRSPDDPLARYVLSALWRTRALYTGSLGFDVSPAIDHAIAGYEAVLQLDTGDGEGALRQHDVYLWTLNELCSSFLIRAEREGLHGADPRPSLDQAIPHCDRALEHDPAFVYPRNNKVIAPILLAEHLVGSGSSPEAAVREATAAIEEVKRVSPQHPTVPFWLTSLRLIEATWRLESGVDAEAAILDAETSARELERHQPWSPTSHRARGEASLLRARWLMAQERDPTAALLEARRALRHAMETTPWDAGYRVWNARAEIIALRWALRKGGERAVTFEAALAPILPLLEVQRVTPHLYLALAEIHELRAASRLDRREAEKDIAEGLRRTEETLAIHPHLGNALACKGRLLLLRARRSTTADRRAAATQAGEAFAAAILHNPQLARTQRHNLDEARQMAGSSGSPTDLR
ncbi:serine/threonine-protein kinase [Chondromyces crocatus]|uniref:serine/threonine-protein kinase n=1 Tax=Chondromyces crocatus TaxID=52 RepID=UPI001C54D497|nr:serine/threonine-protein kinase [Chondromyces crocatus]